MFALINSTCTSTYLFYNMTVCLNSKSGTVYITGNLASQAIMRWVHGLEFAALAMICVVLLPGTTCLPVGNVKAKIIMPVVRQTVIGTWRQIE